MLGCIGCEACLCRPGCVNTGGWQRVRGGRNPSSCAMVSCMGYKSVVQLPSMHGRSDSSMDASRSPLHANPHAYHAHCKHSIPVACFQGHAVCPRCCTVASIARHHLGGGAEASTAHVHGHGGNIDVDGAWRDIDTGAWGPWTACKFTNQEPVVAIRSA
jgi:hypothetical protein